MDEQTWQQYQDELKSLGLADDQDPEYESEPFTSERVREMKARIDKQFEVMKKYMAGEDVERLETIQSQIQNLIRHK
jgi:hypothetical protein